MWGQDSRLRPQQLPHFMCSETPLSHGGVQVPLCTACHLPWPQTSLPPQSEPGWELVNPVSCVEALCMGTGVSCPLGCALGSIVWGGE